MQQYLIISLEEPYPVIISRGMDCAAGAFTTHLPLNRCFGYAGSERGGEREESFSRVLIPHPPSNPVTQNHVQSQSFTPAITRISLISLCVRSLSDASSISVSLWYNPHATHRTVVMSDFSSCLTGCLYCWPHFSVLLPSLLYSLLSAHVSALCSH